MRKPMKARSTALRLALLSGAAILGACSGELTSPTASTHSESIEARSMFVPTAAQKALIGVKDGTYKFEVDPTDDEELELGPNQLNLPANSICNLATSGYGPATWNQPCTPHRETIWITVVVKGATSANPRIDFFPAMRFNPTKNVQLFMYVPKVSKGDAKKWVMLYCPDKGKCVDESLSDASLVTNVDRKENMLFRRIKHFSGYLGTGRDEEIVPDLLP